MGDNKSGENEKKNNREKGAENEAMGRIVREFELWRFGDGRRVRGGG